MANNKTVGLAYRYGKNVENIAKTMKEPQFFSY